MGAMQQNTDRNNTDQNTVDNDTLQKSMQANGLDSRAPEQAAKSHLGVESFPSEQRETVTPSASIPTYRINEAVNGDLIFGKERAAELGEMLRSSDKAIQKEAAIEIAQGIDRFEQENGQSLGNAEYIAPKRESSPVQDVQPVTGEPQAKTSLENPLEKPSTDADVEAVNVSSEDRSVRGRLEGFVKKAAAAGVLASSLFFGTSKEAKGDFVLTIREEEIAEGGVINQGFGSPGGGAAFNDFSSFFQINIPDYVVDPTAHSASLIFQQAGNGGANNGDLSTINNWVVGRWDNIADASVEGAGLSAGARGPDDFTIFTVPSNSSWNQRIGDGGNGFDNYRAEFDSLGWNLTPGDTDWISIMPLIRSDSELLMANGLSFNSAGYTDYWDLQADSGAGPQTYADLEYPGSGAMSFSIQGTAVPEPSTFTLLALGSGAGLFWRHRSQNKTGD